MVNSGEAVLNVVSVNKPMMLSGLDQKVSGQVPGLMRPLAQMKHHRRKAATFPTLLQQRNVVSPSSSLFGTARREASPWGGG